MKRRPSVAAEICKLEQSVLGTTNHSESHGSFIRDDRAFGSARFAKLFMHEEVGTGSVGHVTVTPRHLRVLIRLPKPDLSISKIELELAICQISSAEWSDATTSDFTLPIIFDCSGDR